MCLNDVLLMNTQTNSYVKKVKMHRVKIKPNLIIH